MVYQPLHSMPDAPSRHSTSRPLSSQRDRLGTPNDAGIRAVSYDDAYDDGAFIGDERRPPSFRSHDEDSRAAASSSSAAGAGLYLGDHAELTYDNILDSARARQYDPPALAQAPSMREVHDPDLELHLEPPAPLYPHRRRRVDSHDWEEDVKDLADFEESFAADGAGDDSKIEYEEEEDGLHSPALSFHGGFGAPPTVSSFQTSP